MAHDPEKAAEDLARGVALLFFIVMDGDIPVEHKAEVLGATFPPFWDCFRPTFGQQLFDPSDFDFSRVDLSACESEVVQTFLLGAAGHLAGRVVVQADKLHDLRLRADDVETFFHTTADLYEWTESIDPTRGRT